MDFVPELRAKGLLTAEQAERLSEIASGRLVSLSLELRGLLYLGALLIVAGAGATVSAYGIEVGPTAILGFLSLAVAGCLVYCFRRGLPYSRSAVESPTPGFDYVLYLGCALLGVELGYAEARFHLLDRFWDYYLLVSAAWFVFLAYRFDNRLVLSLGLLNAGGWLGVRFSQWEPGYFGLRTRAVFFSLSVLAAGRLLERRGVKAHFADAYYTLGLHVFFIAACAGVAEKGLLSLDFLALLALAAACVAYASRRRLFSYFLYGVGYAYAGFSSGVLREIYGARSVAAYFLVSAAALSVLIFRFRSLLEQKR